MRFGDELILRATNERVVLLGILDAETGAIRVGSPTRTPFEANEADVRPVREGPAGCGCQ